MDAPPTTPEPAPASLTRPPPIVLEAGGSTFATALHSYCWTAPAEDGTSTGSCVDMLAPDDADLTEVSGVDAVEFAVPLDDVRFRAHFTAIGRRGCDHVEQVEALGDGRFRIEPTGRAGTYRVDLLGRTEQGEVPAVFRWTTDAPGGDRTTLTDGCR